MRIPFEFLGKKLTDKQVEALILKGKTPKIKGILIDGQKCNGNIALDPDFSLSFLEEEKEVWTCPVCKQGTLLKGKSAYGCSRYKEGCRFVVPFEFMGKKLSEAQIKSLINTQKNTFN